MNLKSTTHVGCRHCEALNFRRSNEQKEWACSTGAINYLVGIRHTRSQSPLIQNASKDLWRIGTRTTRGALARIRRFSNCSPHAGEDVAGLSG